MSTRRVGCSTSPFIRSSRLVPPAMQRVPGVGQRREGLVDIGRRGRSRRRASRQAVRADGIAHRGDDADVRAAAAQVAAHALANFLVGQFDRACCAARRGVAALAVARALRRAARPPSRSAPACNSRTESRRARRTPPAPDAAPSPGQPFDGRECDRPRAATASVRQALMRRLVDEHRARAALAAIAALLGAGEADVLAQRVEQRHPRLEREIVIVVVDVEANAHWHTRTARSKGVRGRRIVTGCDKGRQVRERRRQCARSAQEAPARGAFRCQATPVHPMKTRVARAGSGPAPLFRIDERAVAHDANERELHGGIVQRVAQTGHRALGRLRLRHDE